MDFKQITTFLQVAESGSFTRAADFLMLSRAMVSIHIKQLESDLGVILLNRNTRSVELTEAGKSFYQDCLLITQNYQDAVEKIQQSETMLSGTLRLGFTYELGLEFIAPIMVKFCRRYPNLAVHYDLNSSLNELITDKLDLVIRLGNLPDSALKSRKIGQYSIVLVAAPKFVEKYPLTQLSDLIAAPWITQNQWNQRSFTLIHQQVKKQPAKEFQFAVPNGQYQSNAAGLTRLMVLEGLGVTICPFWLVKQDIEEGRLVEIFRDYQLPAQDIHLLFLDQNPLPQKVRLAIDWLKEHFRLE